MIRVSLFVILAAAAPAVAQAPESPSAFVKMAGASDLYEMQSSQAVLKTTKNPAVRKYAQTMIKDHGKTTASVMAAAKAAKLPMTPPALDSEKAAMIQQLNGTTGTARDSLYLTQQAMAHRQALALHQGYSADGSQPALKAAATKAVPIVQHHIMMIDQIKAR
ncbi:DUF4142 domain-containing protein [Sphingomonas sp.]|uniref:DUF4142 domain-containing protein n=1 Tax=Sphingomonas sp. TaxID=28214 RepID=UPI002ED97BDE